MDDMLLRLKQGIAYGPVQSRRLGRSLGINLLGGAAKTCTFDCVYCQYGWTVADPASETTHAGLPSVREVLSAVENTLNNLVEPPAYLTFSGNGEPTLHPRFGEIVDGVNALRDRLAPGVPTVVLSNSSRVRDPRVREALLRLDLRIMKLDAGNEETFRRFNRRLGGTSLAQVLDGLRALRSFTVQSLFADGPDGNTDPHDLRAWVGTIVDLAPESVQLYTLDRGYPSDRIGPVGARLLESIRDRLLDFGVHAVVYPPRPCGQTTAGPLDCD
jgi:wyosine [tRNA(Phe)-imidazoG37] synthetase (radical SAM superfamily)